MNDLIHWDVHFILVIEIRQVKVNVIYFQMNESIKNKRKRNNWVVTTTKIMWWSYFIQCFSCWCIEKNKTNLLYVMCKYAFVRYSLYFKWNFNWNFILFFFFFVFLFMMEKNITCLSLFAHIKYIFMYSHNPKNESKWE